MGGASVEPHFGEVAKLAPFPDLSNAPGHAAFAAASTALKASKAKLPQTA